MEHTFQWFFFLIEYMKLEGPRVQTQQAKFKFKQPLQSMHQWETAEHFKRPNSAFRDMPATSTHTTGQN